MDQHSDSPLSMHCVASHLHKWSSLNFSTTAIVEKAANVTVCSFATGVTIHCTQNQMLPLDSFASLIDGLLKWVSLSERVTNNHETKES